MPTDLPHALVTEYSPGTEIGWHKDRPVFEDVIGISLASPCSFRFRRRCDTKWDRHTITAELRSVYLMRGESRWEWEHSIPAVDELRYSITFTSLRDPKLQGGGSPDELVAVGNRVGSDVNELAGLKAGNSAVWNGQVRCSE